MVADVKFSQFTVGNEMMIGDEPVGLRPTSPTENFIFNFPGTGIKDSNGNYLFQYDTAGALAVNHLKLVSSLSAQPVLLTAAGTDTDISISILPVGTGALYLDNLKWPTSDGTAGQFITTDGAGNLSFTSGGGGGSTDIIGTANQVLANGTTGVPQSGTVTLTLPQDIATTSSPTFDAPIFTAPILGTPASGNLVNCTGLLVAGGGTGVSSFTAYSVICGGTTSTGALQSVASVGTTGQVLTSNGAAALPTWQTSGALSGGLLNVQVFKASGTYTPTVGMSNCIIVCVGAGGAGGGATNTAAGSGGGAGGFSQSYITSGTIGVSQTVTIGAGGTGVSNANGNAGGNTSVGSIVIANGGSGGIAGGSTPLTVGASGGTTGTGDVTFTGGSGQISFGNISGNRPTSGNGGDSYFASGALGIAATTGTQFNGNNATANSGAAGSGASSGVGGSAVSGGSGASGIVIIYEYS